jgi:hypothetical protein
MRHFGRFLFSLFCVSLLVPTFASSQQPSWSNILSPSRAIDWKNAGLPAVFPDGETTPNPWTPPTRVACTSAQAGITVPVAAGTSFSSIAAALYNCSKANTSGSYLLLGNGTFTLSSTFYFAGSASHPINNVTLRGSGPQNTTIAFSGTANFQWGWSMGGNGGGTVSSSPAQGATSVTITSTSGTPVVGNLAWLNQCDTGWSGKVVPSQTYNTCSGTYADNGGFYVCYLSTNCASSGGTSSGNSQQQMVKITSVTNNGGGSYTVGFAPGIYLSNWKTSNTIGFYWQSQNNFGIGDGVEDLTFLYPGGANQTVETQQAYASWMKGVMMIGTSTTQQFSIGPLTKNCLLLNNYFFGMVPNPVSANVQIMSIRGDSDNLILNNIFDQGIAEPDGSSEGDVFAYNYSRDISTQYYQAFEFQHNSGAAATAFYLDEGNISNILEYDNIHGTHFLSTSFRNWWSCGDAPLVENGITSPAIQISNYSRFINAIGNALGGQSNACTAYKGTAGGNILQLGNDPLISPTLMLWGQYDTVNGSQQFNSEEVPSSINPNSLCTGSGSPWPYCTGSGSGTGNLSAWNNPVPSSDTLPASFFMDSMNPHSSGGTGLSYWQVCTSWTTFPTSCATTSTPPMPPIHPESNSGAYLNGYVDANPAYLAYQNLPILSAYQNSYTVTGSSWSNGKETLTVSGLPSGRSDIMGGFQLSGATGACTLGATLPNGEILMTGTSSSAISYALPSNPGTSCAGTMKWPDVRNFDERVYESDSSGKAPSPPTGLGGSTQPIP